MPKPMHPLQLATLDALLTSGDPMALNDEVLRRASDYLNRTVSIIGAWPIESKYPNSACVLLEDTFSGGEELLIIRGNAGRQVLYLEDEKMLPIVRVLRELDNGKYFWDDNRAA
jgi:hypothetical protein